MHYISRIYNFVLRGLHLRNHTGLNTFSTLFLQAQNLVFKVCILDMYHFFISLNLSPNDYLGWIGISNCGPKISKQMWCKDQRMVLLAKSMKYLSGYLDNNNKVSAKYVQCSNGLFVRWNAFFSKLTISFNVDCTCAITMGLNFNWFEKKMFFRLSF